jgi:hypothetical protein
VRIDRRLRHVELARHCGGGQCIGTSVVDERDRGEQDAFAALYDPSNVYEHHWAVGDLVVWDNLMLQTVAPATRRRCDDRFAVWP